MIRKHRPARGQTLTEYALILGLVAVCCIAGVAFARDATAAAFEAHAAALDEPPLPTVDESFDLPIDPTATPTVIPTATPEPYTVPTSKADCRNGGWRDFNPPDGPFTSQSDCISYVTEAAVTPTSEPTATPETMYIVPERRSDCRNGGWQDFVTPEGTFSSQAECFAYVDSH